MALTLLPREDMSANTVWWIFMAILVGLMLWRGCCAMGMSPRRSQGREARGKSIDPVCRMAIDPNQAVGTRTRDGETYFFCSQTCVDAFDASPAMYSQRHEHREHQHHGC